MGCVCALTKQQCSFPCEKDARVEHLCLSAQRGIHSFQGRHEEDSTVRAEVHMHKLWGPQYNLVASASDSQVEMRDREWERGNMY